MATSRSKQTAKPKAKAAAKAKARPAKAAKAAAKPKPAMKAKSAPAKKAPPAKSAPKVAAKPVKVAAPAKPAVKAGPRPLNKGALAAKALAAAAKAAKAAKIPPKKKVAPPAVVRPLGVLPPESRMPEARVKVVEKAPQIAARPRPTSPHPISKPAASGVQRVSEKDLKLFEERLLAERQKIMKEMGHLEDTVLKVNQRDSSGDLSGYSFHMADAGTDAMEREKAFMFASSEGRMLMEINEALRRIYAGEYGMCEMCGNPIARARLEAMPYARLCVSCKEQEEKANRGKAQAPTPGNH
jgi:RNA polymerase-binding protein DksA